MKTTTLPIGTPHFGFEISGGIKKDIMKYISVLEKISYDIILELNEKNDVSPYSLILDSVKIENEMKTYQKVFNVVGSSFMIREFNSDLETLKNKINDKIDRYIKENIGIQEISTFEQNGFNFIKITFSHKDWKNIKNYSYIDSLIKILEENSDGNYFSEYDYKTYITVLKDYRNNGYFSGKNTHYDFISNIEYFFKEDSKKYSDLYMFFKDENLEFNY